MIKIEHKDMTAIAERYFDKIKPLIQKRASFYQELYTVLFSDGEIQDLYDYNGLRWNAKISLINNFLGKNKLNPKSNSREQYNCIILENVTSFVLEYETTIPALLNFLQDEDNLRSILICSAEDSIQVDLLIKHTFNLTDAKRDKTFLNWIGSIIDYNLFDGFAYGIASELQINTCPYCNRNYINTIIDNNKNIIRPQFDHFFPKSEHQFLALSFYNLIPSCYYCNSSLKSAASITHETHLHPYMFGYGEACVFGFEYEKLKLPIRHPENFKVNLVPGLADTERVYRQIFGMNNKEGNTRLFKIKEIYHAGHRDIIGEMKERVDRYSSAQAQAISGFFKELETNKSEFYQFYFGNFMEEVNFNRRPMAKFTRDIVRQMIPDFFKEK